MIHSHIFQPRWILYTLLFSLLLLSLPARSDSAIYTKFFSDVAVSGYDSVAYFQEDKAVKGDENFTINYKGAVWQFKNQENLDTFTLAPDKYAPQYGGYCAWAVAQNNTAKGDPEQWYIHHGKLYLNYDKDIRDKWLQDKESLIEQANTHWPTVLN
jgi:YHS domain-containing protein